MAPGLLDIVGEAADVDTAIKVVPRRTARCGVLLDVHLPGAMAAAVSTCSGCVAVDSRRGVPVRFLALSVSDAAEDVLAVIPRRVARLCRKSITGTDLAAAIKRVADGDAVFSPRLAGFVLDAFGVAAGEIAEVDEEWTGSPSAGVK